MESFLNIPNKVPTNLLRFRTGNPRVRCCSFLRKTGAVLRGLIVAAVTDGTLHTADNREADNLVTRAIV